MKPTFMQSFLQSKIKVGIYAIVKISLASIMFYFFSQEVILGKKIIFLAFGFLILMSMVPIVVLHQLELKKKKDEK